MMPKNALMNTPKNLSVLIAPEGTWLYFITSSGKSAGVRVEAIAKDRGPLVRETLMEWCSEQAKASRG